MTETKGQKRHRDPIKKAYPKVSFFLITISSINKITFYSQHHYDFSPHAGNLLPLVL